MMIKMPEEVKKLIFLALLVSCLVLNIDPPLALLMGLILAFTIGHPYLHLNQRATTLLLQLSVVCLGFHMNLQEAIKAGRQGLLFTIASISITLIAGYLIGRKLKIDKKTSYLISNGTAICGGSAIAAIGPLIKANEQQMSVALGTIFILNSIALFLFPWVGHLMNFSQVEFGTWCAIAIHDTSSVVGAAAKFGQEAMQVATTIKLERALWIIPISLLTAYFQKNSRAKIKLPYFIFYFILAIFIYTYFPQGQLFYKFAYMFGKKGLVVTLFLIGSGLSFNTVKTVGWRPIVQGALLWATVSISSLLAIKHLV